MDNLIELTLRRSLISIIMLIFTFIVIIIEYRKITRLSKDKKKKRDAISKIVVCFLLIIYGVHSAKPAYLDYTKMDTQSTRGTVQEERRIHRRKSGTKYEYIILTEEGEEIKVYISGGKTDEYPLKEGKEYIIEYFTRTKAVYSVTLIE